MVDNFDVECPENGDVKYGGERLMWSVVENGDIGAQRVIL